MELLLLCFLKKLSPAESIVSQYYSSINAFIVTLCLLFNEFCPENLNHRQMRSKPLSPLIWNFSQKLCIPVSLKILSYDCPNSIFSILLNRIKRPFCVWMSNLSCGEKISLIKPNSALLYHITYIFEAT